MKDAINGTMAGDYGYVRGGDSPYDYLAASIVAQAAKDYVKITRRLWDKKVSIKTKRCLILDKTELEEFFHSEWYVALSNIDPDRLIAACKHRAKELEKETIRRKNKLLIKQQLKEQGKAGDENV